MESGYEKIVKKAIKGNKNAFEQLIKQHYEQIYRTAYVYVHNEADALDVVQEATYQALCSIYSLKNPEYFMTWFTKIIIRCSGQVLKKQSKVVPLSDDNLLQELPAAASNHDETMHILHALNQLPENYRTVLILFYYHDYSIKTISEILGIPEGTVKTYLSRGKTALKKYFEGEEQSHG
ncbi:sigma-70 family RNA polymerase sigma factor [Bacillus rubiinfantis]|uniref:sigma-70 family RNA polymerase sigma factor n=1 Tax=Bacillus rubiinfantis TaxID=1499680 RepID=UPI0006941486|nr:sigma-70 family RNA polymerase sigma factor [Bacillus rubiinfantis]